MLEARDYTTASLYLCYRKTWHAVLRTLQRYIRSQKETHAGADVVDNENEDPVLVAVKHTGSKP